MSVARMIGAVGIACAIAFTATAASAHNLWVQGENKEVFEADLIYGHHFPTPEKIAEERLQLFEPVQISGEDLTETLTQQGENYHYEGTSKLSAGTYLVGAYYKLTPWVEASDGTWHMDKTRKDFKDTPRICYLSSMQSKAVVVVGNDDGSYATTPLGKGLEITPLNKASEFRQGEAIKFKLTRDGERVKMASIVGSFSGYSENEMSFPFYAKTNIDGVFEFKPLQAGTWYLSTSIESPSGNPDCETRIEKTSIVFSVK
ncbi:DUF4198 domain-containing protein [Oceanidesulfovibrio marinus]|uniref:DUF4198 domain-containing protein n=1 Tax=Oceanidesulfovibrio marinus TaxID=370038 RepID=A0A6P1ZK31_9BACT|nr:DUF4198 domain-containing protein [Oceanidesulfovibrio marinus]TVM34139.1 DUF4198 domain-containing protein [Oceanidesulfovibrio marinus]